jgi:hypothetical protein
VGGIAVSVLAAITFTAVLTYFHTPPGQVIIEETAHGLESLGEQLKPKSEPMSDVCEFGKGLGDKYGPLWKAPGMPGWKNPQEISPHDPEWWNRPPDWDKWSKWKQLKWLLKKAAGALTEMF